MYSCDSKAKLSAAIAPVFRESWSFRNRSNIKKKSHEYWLLHGHTSKKAADYTQISLRILLLCASNKRPLRWLLQQPHTL